MVWRDNPTLQDVFKRDRIERPYIKKDGSVSSKPRVFFRCALCANEYKRLEVQVDHKEPVGPTPGSKLAPPGLTWDAFIDRMFCPLENLQLVCKTCHSKKTAAETAERFRKLADAI